MIQSGIIDSFIWILKTANLVINFVIRRLAEIFGIILFFQEH